MSKTTKNALKPKSIFFAALIFVVFMVIAFFFLNRLDNFLYNSSITKEPQKNFQKSDYNEIEKNKKTENEILNNGEEGDKDTEEININTEEEKADGEKKRALEEKNILLNAPFVSQAPFGNWSDPRKQDGCEEAAAIMAMAWVNNRKLTSQMADEKIDEISVYEEKMYGNSRDTNAQDTAQRIFKGFFKYDNIEVKHGITKENIKQELFSGNLVIVPTNGRLLNNPNYTFPGPATHNLVVIGYDAGKKEFITNDPGTRRGEKYRYNEDVLENALSDYPTGNHEKIEEIKTAMIIVWK